MRYFFKEKLFNDEKFKNMFLNMENDGRIISIPSDIWDIIESDSTLIKIEDEKYLTLSQILKEGYSEGKCFECSAMIVMLLNLNGYNASQIEGMNTNFKGTKGSPNGGHYYVELVYNNERYILDTSLVCMIKRYNTYILGYSDINEIRFDTMLETPAYLSIYETIKRNRKR